MRLEAAKSFRLTDPTTHGVADEQQQQQQPSSSSDEPYGRPLVARWSAQEQENAIGAHIMALSFAPDDDNRKWGACHSNTPFLIALRLVSIN